MSTTESRQIRSAVNLSSDRIAYSITEAAALVGLPRNTLRDRISRGEIRAVKRCGKWLIKRDTLLRWLES